MSDDERLSAYLDGELDGPDRSTLDARLAIEPTLRAKLDRLRAGDSILRRAARATGDRPMPRTALECHRVPGPRSISANDNGGGRWARVAAMASIFMVGGAVGGLLASGNGIAGAAGVSDPFEPGEALVAALETQPSGHPVALGRDRSIVMRVSYPGAADAAWCRQFDIESPNGRRSGVACRDRTRWRINGLVESVASPASAGAGYVVAGGAADPVVDALVGASRGGDPIAPSAEAQLIARRWRSP